MTLALTAVIAATSVAAGSGADEGAANRLGEPKNGSTISNYVLGADDQITLLTPYVDEINGKAFRIDKNGEVQLPLVGPIQVSGLTAAEAGKEVETKLERFVKSPEAVITITEFRSQPVSVLGAVGAPGIYQIQGRKTLFEVLSLAGGLRPDSGDRVEITRDLRSGRIPLPQATDDVTGRFSVASVRVKSIMDASKPTENITIAPNDIVSVPKAELVFVVGAVRKPGGFVLGQDETMSVLQAVSLAEGTEPTAATKSARIMREIPGTTSRIEIRVNLAKLLSGKSNDDPHLNANDILFVPNSTGKSIGAKVLEGAITAATGAAIYRP